MRFRIVAWWLAVTMVASASIPPARIVYAADGAVPLSLPELLAEAHRANPDLAAARKRWEAAQARIPLARGLPAPRIGVEWEEIPKGTFKVNQAMLMVSLLQSLPFPGKLSTRQKVAVKEAQMAATMFKQAEWEVTTRLKSAYYDLFLVERELEARREQVLWLDQAAAVAQTRYATGLGMQSEVLQVQSEALSASNETEVLTHRRQAILAHLNHLLNRPSAGPLGSPGPIPLVPVPGTPDELLMAADDNQPELLTFKFSAERAEAAWKLSKRELLPDLETMVELRDPAMGPIGPWDLTLALVLPFWFWTKQRYGVKAALYDKDSAELAYQGVRNEISRRIHEGWHEAKGAYATAALCQDGLIPQAEQAVSSAMAAYQGGKGSFGEMLEALRNLSERRRTYYQHLVALEQRLVMLEQSTGIPLRPSHELFHGGEHS